MTTVNIYDMVQTWNNGATVFDAIKMNVTDTASAAGSLLLNLQVNGVSVLTMGKQVTGGRGLAIGNATAAGGTNWSYLKFDTAWGDVDFTVWGGRLIVTGAGLLETIFNSNLSATPTHFIGIEATNGTINAALYSDTTNSFDQRNGANAQTFNLYNTFTDASNYERGFMKWNSNILEIGTEAAGTGTGRDVIFKRNGLNYFRLNGQFEVALEINRRLSIPAGSWIDIQENGSAVSAPAANKVRIYAEDDGAGKTRLMALFPTGVAQQIAIEP